MFDSTTQLNALRVWSGMSAAMLRATTTFMAANLDAAAASVRSLPDAAEQPFWPIAGTFSGQSAAFGNIVDFSPQRPEQRRPAARSTTVAAPALPFFWPYLPTREEPRPAPGAAFAQASMAMMFAWLPRPEAPSARPAPFGFDPQAMLRLWTEPMLAASSAMQRQAMESWSAQLFGGGVKSPFNAAMPSPFDFFRLMTPAPMAPPFLRAFGFR